MPRTNIAIDEKIADSLADEATKENKSLYGLSNEALTAVLRICGYGGAPKEVYPSWRLCRMLQDTDAVPLPGELVEKLMSKMYSIDKDWLLKEWYDQGKHVGSYLHMYAPNFELLVSRVEELEGFLPVKRVEFERKDTPDKIEMGIKVIGAGYSLESTRCTEQFILGLLSDYPYKVLSSRVTEGLIEVKLEEIRERKIIS